jgi:hypothetical protein
MPQGVSSPVPDDVFTAARRVLRPRWRAVHRANARSRIKSSAASSVLASSVNESASGRCCVRGSEEPGAIFTAARRVLRPRWRAAHRANARSRIKSSAASSVPASTSPIPLAVVSDTFLPGRCCVRGSEEPGAIFTAARRSSVPAGEQCAAPALVHASRVAPCPQSRPGRQ